ncbi:MAG: PA14 domain-containing protein [Lachnospiraceae bacterium]|nr:PA14 domain-containing protein [Lachnospiraceae bacterium]
MEQIIYGNIRVQLLSDEIVRIEYGKDGKFCDENTFFIPNKEQYTENKIAYKKKEGIICFGEYTLYLPLNADSLVGVRLEQNGKRVYSYQTLANSGELPPLDKTPDVFALSDTPRIFVPEGGYSAVRKGEFMVEENVQDIYLLFCKKDAKKLRRLYVQLTGKCELVRLSTLGGWNSKYFVYDEESARQLILDYEAHNFPLDNMVIDTDWRAASDCGIGYDVDLKLFPDMARFMSFAHSHGVNIMFNDHPEPLEGAKDLTDPKEIAYREEKLQSIMQMGLDTWWYDRNWNTKLISPSQGVNPETLGLYLFQDVTRNFWQKKANNKEIYRRPDIMGNVDNVSNGAYAAVESSASHRYSIQWTGDVASDYAALRQEVDSLIRGGNNAIAYINADCGGHTGNPTKEEFIRWMQFGTLSPVFRPHCTLKVIRTREPWVYDKETEDIVREYNNLRYRLLPVIYKNAYENYCTGEPIFKALGYEYPNDKQALAQKDEYMLGNNLLISPVSGVQYTLLNCEEYLEPVKATFYRGTELQGDPIAFAEWKPLYMNMNGTSPLENVPVFNFSAKFETTIKVDSEKELVLKSDDGATVWIDGRKVLEDKTCHGAILQRLGTVSANEPHKVEIEYFQAGGAAFCGLYTCDALLTDSDKKVYLPEGKWLNAFSGEVFEGKQFLNVRCALNESPLFVRLGALLPLAYEAKNTKEQKWNRLVYDFYPDKEASDCGYLYEDDTETTAYKLGQFRKSVYEAKYCEECNAFVVKLYAAEGNFAGEKCFTEREVTLKYHLLKGADQVKRITVNGEDAEGILTVRDQNAFPLNAGASAPDSDVLTVSVKTDVTKNYEIKFYL